MKKSYFKYFTALLLLGSNGIVASSIHLSSYEIVLLRAIWGIAFLLILFFAGKNKVTAFQHKSDLLFIAISGIAMAADWLLLFEAYVQIGVSLSTLINYCGPVIVIAFSPFLLKERITSAKIIALATALMGIIFISGQASAAGLSAWGLLCAGLSAVAYAAMVLSNKLAKGITGTEKAALQMLFGTVAIVIFVGCKQGFSIEIVSGDWLPVLWIGLVNTGIGCYCYFSSIGDLPAQSVAVCGYLEPVFAVLLSVILLHETMLPLQILGAALIFGGAIFGECYKKEKSPHNNSSAGIR